MELFCNKDAMHLARYPNDTLIPLGKVLDPGSIPRNGDFRIVVENFIIQLMNLIVDRSKDIWISGFFAMAMPMMRYKLLTSI
jgi:hypothetical protein